MTKSYIYEMLPEFGTPIGMVFYTLMIYLISMLASWLFTSDEDLTPEEQQRVDAIKKQGKMMRDRNK